MLVVMLGTAWVGWGHVGRDVDRVLCCMWTVGSDRLTKTGKASREG